MLTNADLAALEAERDDAQRIARNALNENGRHKVEIEQLRAALEIARAEWRAYSERETELMLEVEQLRAALELWPDRG